MKPLKIISFIFILFLCVLYNSEDVILKLIYSKFISGNELISNSNIVEGIVRTFPKQIPNLILVFFTIYVDKSNIYSLFIKIVSVYYFGLLGIAFFFSEKLFNGLEIKYELKNKVPIVLVLFFISTFSYQFFQGFLLTNTWYYDLIESLNIMDISMVYSSSLFVSLLVNLYLGISFYLVMNKNNNGNVKWFISILMLGISPWVIYNLLFYKKENKVI
ncbi:hypothetical protein [Flammeovirga kamogawensis]|uniref:Yip1 domain-containing protein n=1 Tax=Flammeovirga kamogawensis TaxID=373891 RepID=A0ABX8H1W7_9BACT|nr:hypothetical protein [Flammeovirga kamogawensis]MBB6464098.1 hypothetical protein [Flammeovirga kamogawensis]QWG09895.1 hypothetical protein KM029_19635 [Flammeovirga kamogawensis]TRX65399.1 hypothetical protein EO216_23030 [Flammeovirga kamogawensis]